MPLVKCKDQKIKQEGKGTLHADLLASSNLRLVTVPNHSTLFQKLGFKYQRTLSTNSNRQRHVFLGEMNSKKVVLKVGQEEANLREVRNLEASLGLRHDHLAEVLNAWLSIIGGKFHAVSMEEYIEGENVLELVLRGQQFAPKQFGDAISEAVSGLNYLHENSIIHRDIKPDNVMIDKQNKIQIVDLAACKPLLETDLSWTKSKFNPGSRYFQPIEVITQTTTRPNSQVDIYGMGLVLYYGAVGRIPFDDCESLEELKDAKRNLDPEPIKVLDVKFDKEHSRIISKMIDKHAVLRYNTCQEILNELEEHAQRILSAKSKQVRDQQSQR